MDDAFDLFLFRFLLHAIPPTDLKVVALKPVPTRLVPPRPSPVFAA